MEQKCENCRFFCKLNLFARYVGTVGGIGCVSGWRVEKMHSKFQESCGCNVFNVLLTDSGIVNETLPHDVCELFKPKVITLYKVELYVGEEFNKQFIQKNLDKLAEDKKILEAKRAEIAEEKSAYQEIIKSNEDLINEYRGTIKMLERNNADYKDAIESMDARCSKAELAVKRDIEALVMRREF